MHPYLLGGHEIEPARLPDEQLRWYYRRHQRRGGRGGRQQGGQLLLQRRYLPGRRQQGAHPRQAAGKPVGVQGLEQVVHRVLLEGLQGVMVVGRHEHYQRQRPAAQAPQHLHAGQVGQLHIQKHQIDDQLFGLQGRQGFGAVAALAHHFHVGRAGQQLHQAAARQRLIIHQQGPDYFHKAEAEAEAGAEE